MYTTLISTYQLQALPEESTVIFDCSFDLQQPAAARQVFQELHIKNALWADLDNHLSDHGAPLSQGRHPLPQPDKLSAWLGECGLGNAMQAVVYDRNGGNFCGRLWWLLKWLGHDAVAILDGGLAAWQTAGGATESGDSRSRLRQPFSQHPALVTTVSKEEVMAGGYALIDARATSRYQGLSEPIDPVAGHIPGALNRPFSENLDASGHFKSSDELRLAFSKLLGTTAADKVACYCGSGVSAIPNIVAMELAGLGRAPLYPGGWSEWCRDPSLSVARG